MTDIEWGPEIAIHDGKRPGWLDTETQFLVYGGGREWSEPYTDAGIASSTWQYLDAIRLPSTHWAYLPMSRGFEPWAGGDEAPGDWDGGEVLDFSGYVCPAKDVFNAKWRRGWKHDPRPVDGDIIGYRRRGEVYRDCDGPRKPPPRVEPKPDYELEADGWKYRSGHRHHRSDCATSRAPAERPGPCDCGGVGDPDTVTIRRMTEAEVKQAAEIYAGGDWTAALVYLHVWQHLGLIRPATPAERIATTTNHPIATVQEIMAAVEAMKGEG